VLKANYALYWWNPGTNNIDLIVNPNAPDWYQRYAWNDANHDGVFQLGEQGQLIDQRGGVGSTQLDPNLQDARTREVATFLERELFPNIGVHAGFVWRRIDQLSQRDNKNRPISAYDVPVTIPVAGPDGKIVSGGPTVQAFDLDPASLPLSVVNLLHNTPGRDDFYNIELGAFRRLTGGWSLNASYAFRWNYDNATGYFGNTLRGQADVANPNDAINTDSGRYDFTTWTAKINGTYDAPWGLRLTPAIRMQSGQPFARTFVAPGCPTPVPAVQNCLRYSTSQRILAEPFGTRRQDNIVLLDTRIERLFRIAGSRTIAGFIDFYNLTNSNAAQNIVWGSGSSFLQPTTIVPPRLLRFGAKFDW
jgi:hypothetical protein